MASTASWLRSLSLVLIAFFVFLGATAEAEAVETRAAGDGLQVSQMMVTNFRTIPVHGTLADAVDLLLSGEQREFPVVDNNGRIEGHPHPRQPDPGALHTGARRSGVARP